jgi:positive regulator of sigma E activity
MHHDKTDWVTAIGAALSVILGFMNENAAALGVIIGILGLLMQWHYKRKHLELREKEIAEEE